jgi:F-type H+-transporting ATPase subunit epsilon
LFPLRVGASSRPGTGVGEETTVAKTFQAELVSVEAMVWSGEAEEVFVRTVDGEMAVLAGHAPLLGQLKEPSRVRVKTADGDEVAYDIAGGFVSVTDDGVTVLAESAAPAEGEDPARAATGSASTTDE